VALQVAPHTGGNIGGEEIRQPAHDLQTRLEIVGAGAAHFDGAFGLRGFGYSVTSKLNIMPLSWCSAMWQCAIH
jgi:hypothetical protein